MSTKVSVLSEGPTRVVLTVCKDGEQNRNSTRSSEGSPGENEKANGNGAHSIPSSCFHMNSKGCITSQGMP